jgi:hypothetical protein
VEKEKGRRFSLRPKKDDAPPAPESEESSEERLARLRARKAELEAQQQRNDGNGKA